MYKLEDIADGIRQNFDVRTAKRDEALKLARQLTRACSVSIRAVHRPDDACPLLANLPTRITDYGSARYRPAEIRRVGRSAG